MSGAVRTPVQQRDGTRATVPPEPDAIVTRPWTPRTDGKRALLVSERTTVFDRPAPPPPAIDAVAEISDPIWDHKAGTAWTPDLVHCRLLVVGEIVRKLPPAFSGHYVSTLADTVIEQVAEGRRLPPTPAEITLADWTLFELASIKWRRIAVAASLGYSPREIARALNAKGEKTSKSAVHRRYMQERRYLAGRWQQSKVPVDRLSWQRWQELFLKREN